METQHNQQPTGAENQPDGQKEYIANNAYSGSGDMQFDADESTPDKETFGPKDPTQPQSEQNQAGHSKAEETNPD